jgi:putative hydrolase of the HAD superfamily
MPQAEGVLFDLFDTLCRIDEDLYLAGKRSAAALLGVQPARFLEAWVVTQDEAQDGRLPDLEARVRRVAAALGAPFADEAKLSQVAALERDTLLRATALHPDALPALRSLREVAGLRLALVSNASAAAEDLARHLGLDPFFDAFAWSFRVGALKPDPAIYLDACRALGVPPGRCLFVGDGNARELDGARALGMRAVRIERVFSLGPYRREQSRTFDASIDDLRRVRHLLEI